MTSIYDYLCCCCPQQKTSRSKKDKKRANLKGLNQFISSDNKPKKPEWDDTKHPESIKTTEMTDIYDIPTNKFQTEAEAGTAVHLYWLLPEQPEHLYWLLP